jgi:hypothetical protein
VEDILIEKTKETPAIKFDPKDGFLEIKGRSISANPLEFYQPLMASLEKYCNTPAIATTVNIQLEYFNTSSSRCLLNVLKHLSTIHKQGNSVNINWQYEVGDENMRDVGIDYQAIVDLPFEMEEVPAE